MSIENSLNHIDFNKLAAFMDGNLPFDEMESMEDHISSDMQLSAMLNEIDELDNQIIDNMYPSDIVNDELSDNIDLPVVDSSFSYIVFSNPTDSSIDLMSSLYAVSLSDDIDLPHLDVSDDGMQDDLSDNIDDSNSLDIF